MGSGKSGTTWLLRLLDAHPEVLCRGEGRLFSREWHRDDLRDMGAKAEKNRRIFEEEAGNLLVKLGYEKGNDW